MSLKKKLHPLSHKPFVGSVELIPPPPFYIEFIDADRVWGFPIHQLAQFVLEDILEHHGKRNLPPHQLTLSYSRSLVMLRGWRLELMIGPLVSGRITRVHAEKHLGTLIIEEAWVSEIHVQRLDNVGEAEHKFEKPEKAHR